MIPIQATVTGYGGKPATLFSSYDAEVGILAVVALASYREERRETCVVVTNDPRIPRDSWFSNEQFPDAIRAYNELARGVASDGVSQRFQLGERAQLAAPQSAIEQDGFDESGPKFRLNSAMTNAQVAALATAWYALRHAGKADDVRGMLGALSEIVSSINSGRVVTI